MPEFETMITVALAGLALSATPGPSMLYVLSRSVGQSRAAGFASAIGLGLGGVLLAIATAFGLSIVFATFEWVVPALRLIGSLYLVWLGVDLIREAYRTSDDEMRTRAVRHRSFGSIIWQGVWIELLNPKTVLFFALFLPPFVETGTTGGREGPVWLQFLVLGALVPITAVPSDLAVAWMGGTAAERLTRSRNVRIGLAWTGGLILIGIAGNLHLGLI